MKAILWSWGIGTENHDHVYADHQTKDTDGPTPRFGSDIYKAYMQELAKKYPGQFPDELKQVQEITLSKLDSMPEQAA